MNFSGSWEKKCLLSLDRVISDIMWDYFSQNATKSLSCSHERLKILSIDLPYCFLQSTIIQWQILFVEKPNNYKSVFNPLITPNHEFSENSYLAKMIHNICLLFWSPLKWTIPLLALSPIYPLEIRCPLVEKSPLK